MTTAEKKLQDSWTKIFLWVSKARDGSDNAYCSVNFVKERRCKPGLQPYPSVTRRFLAVPRCRHQLRILGPQAFSVAGPSLWHSLPDSLRDPDLGRDSFRRLLNIHLFTLYWSI